MRFFNIKPVFLFSVSLYSLSLSLIKHPYTIYLTCSTFNIIISLLQPENSEREESQSTFYLSKGEGRLEGYSDYQRQASVKGP
jgi:hypothetical protein